MNFLTATHTDVGTRKKTNQDSMIIMQAETKLGNVLFASVCDGMGGLAKGEVASAAMVNAFARWFEKDLPALLEQNADGTVQEESLWKQWSALIDSTSR